MMRPVVAHRDVLHRHLLADDRVVDGAAHDLARVQAAGHQRPLGLVDRLAHQVLLDQCGPVVRPHLAEHDELGILVLLGRPCVRPVDRDEEEQVGEAEVGQDAPAAEEALEVLELVGLEVGVALAPARPVWARFPPLLRRNADGHLVRSPGPVALQGVGPGRGEHRPQVVGPVGHVLEVVGVRRGRQRHAALDEAAQQTAGPGTARPPACASPAEDTSAAMPDRRGRLGHAVPPLVRRVGHVARRLDEVGMGQHVARPRGRQLLERLGVGLPAGVDLAGRPLGHGDAGRRGRRSARPRPSAPSPAARRRGSRPAGRPRRPCGPA